MARGASRAFRLGATPPRMAAAAKEPRYITTPIYYVNGQPHIGHVYTSLACDVLARFSRLDGHEVLFLTGTDEHGQKVRLRFASALQRSARGRPRAGCDDPQLPRPPALPFRSQVEQSALASGESPQHFADRVSETFRSLLPLYDFSADQFIRTTEPRHKAAAQALWSSLVESGDIYLGAYEGWYSVRDEAFYAEDELVGGLAPTGAPVEWVAESSYFFRLSKYKEPLVAHIEANPDFILPLSRRNEVLAFMREGLRDLSVSRTTFAWGIEVPAAAPDSAVAVPPPEGDGLSHIMYVWLDALTNYLTALGYPDTEDPRFKKFWPASLHMVGKDILRFHAIYWPAFLLAAKLPLPKKLFAHGWWMNDGQKMSKSIGNVIDPFLLVDKYGSDAVRYFMMNEVSFGSDGDFAERKLIDCFNSKLANELGNLAYRTLSFTHKQCEAAVPARGALSVEDEAMLAECAALLPTLRGHVDGLALHRYTQALSALAQAGNRYIDVQAPWALKATSPERMRTVLWVLLEVVRHLAIASQPVTPALAAEMLSQLGVDEGEGRDFAALEGGAWQLQAEAPLPPPRILIPRFEEEEAEEPGAPQLQLAGAELEALVADVGAAAERVRELKTGGAAADEVGAAVVALLGLKARLPPDHELNQKPGKKKGKKQKAPAA